GGDHHRGPHQQRTGYRSTILSQAIQGAAHLVPSNGLGSRAVKLSILSVGSGLDEPLKRAQITSERKEHGPEQPKPQTPGVANTEPAGIGERLAQLEQAGGQAGGEVPEGTGANRPVQEREGDVGRGGVRGGERPRTDTERRERPVSETRPADLEAGEG